MLFKCRIFSLAHGGKPRIVYSDFMMSVLFVTFITKATPETENHGISTSEEVLNIKNIQQ